MARQQDNHTHAVACSTHIGRTHQKNQDSGGAWTGIRRDGTPASLVVVADGVSAGQYSERASRLASDLLRDRVLEELLQGEGDVSALLGILVQAGEEASRLIAEQSRDLVASSDATTLAAAICVDRQAVGIWCGDSRVYRVAHSAATRLTRDHSWAEGVVSHGLMSAEQASRDPRAHMITRWLGPQEEALPGIDTFEVSAELGDIILCCTDGLYAYMTPPEGRDEDLSHFLAKGDGSLQSRLDRMVNSALARGGHDDITGAAIEVTS